MYVCHICLADVPCAPIVIECRPDEGKILTRSVCWPCGERYYQPEQVTRVPRREQRRALYAAYRHLDNPDPLRLLPPCTDEPTGEEPAAVRQ